MGDAVVSQRVVSAKANCADEHQSEYVTSQIL